MAGIKKRLGILLGPRGKAGKDGATPTIHTGSTTQATGHQPASAELVPIGEAEYRLDVRIPKSDVPPIVKNLYDSSKEVPGTLSPSGNINEHHVNVVSDWIPVNPSSPYVTYTPDGFHRVVFFDASQQPISGTDTEWQPLAELIHWDTPENAAYMRIGLQLASHLDSQGAVVNYGQELWEPNKEIRSGWWDDRELPPGASFDEEQVTSLVESLLPQYEPSVPKLQFETIQTGAPEPYWLSEDGQILYGRNQRQLVQSVDEWETHQTVTTFDTTIQAIRTLGDGQLLVSLNKDANNPESRAHIVRSYGYTREDPENATWEVVATSHGEDALVNNSWGMTVYQNIVVAGEYGLWGEEGARLVWFSEDHGKTFTQVFDQRTTEVEGRPPWTESAHMHTAVYDPYWARIWVVTGDANNNATYYSDDKGQTWTFVEGSDQMQYTGIMALPDVVVFGSDAPPNGIHVYRRGDKTDMPKILPVYLIDESDIISRVFQLAYKRDWHPTTPTYFAASTASNRGPTLIVGTVDGKKFHTLWEGTQPGSGETYSGNIRWALGPTAQGNIIAPMTGDPTVTGTRVMKAPAPSWARA